MKLLRSVLLVALMLVVATSSATAGDEANQGDIVINEFMADPASPIGDDAGEWIEIVNTTGSTINIDGWTLKDDDFDSHVIDNGGTLNVAPGDYVVLCRNSDPGSNGGVNCDYQYSGFQLANAGDEIVLKDPSGDEIARRNYSSSSSGKSSFYVPSAQPPAGGYYNDQQDNNRWANTDNIVANQYTTSNYGTPDAKNTQTGEGGTPTAIILRTLTASSGGTPILLVGVLSALALMAAGGVLLAYRRRMA